MPISYNVKKIPFIFTPPKPFLSMLILQYTLQLLSFSTPDLINRQLVTKNFNSFGLNTIKVPDLLIRKPIKWVRSLPNLNRGEVKVNFLKHPTKHFYKLFIVFLRLSFKNTSFFFKAHYANRLLFNLNTRDSLLSLNTTTLHTRWKNFYDLLTNLLFLNLRLFFLGSKFLWGEIVASNWLNFRSKSLLRWSIARSFFFFDHNPNLFSGLTFERFLELEPDFIFVLDIQRHRTHLFFLRPYNIFLIGLVPANLNPWELNYPIPVFNSSLLIQYYFLKLYFTVLRLTTNLRYLAKKRLWRALDK